MKITSIALAALPLAAAEKLAGGLPVDCVAFQDADSSLESTASTLGMGRCLKSGDAICSSTGSSTGSWAFGIDRTDGTVKLWEDDRVSFLLLMPIRSFVVIDFHPGAGRGRGYVCSWPEIRIYIAIISYDI